LAKKQLVQSAIVSPLEYFNIYIGMIALRLEQPLRRIC